MLLAILLSNITMKEIVMIPNAQNQNNVVTEVVRAKVA